jgi:hypothetical protein
LDGGSPVDIGISGVGPALRGRIPDEIRHGLLKSDSLSYSPLTEQSLAYVDSFLARIDRPLATG